MRGVKGDEVLHFFASRSRFFGTISKEECCSMFDINFEIELLFQRTFFFFFSFCIFYICIACNVICTHVEETIDDIDYLIRALYFICLSYLSFATYIEIFINFKSFTKEAYSLNTPTDPNYFIYEQ